MSPRVQVCQQWQRQLDALLPTVRATRRRVLLLLVLGLLWAGTVRLPEVAAAWPRERERATNPSRERRLRRWLRNRDIDARAIWAALLPSLLAAKAGQDLVLVFDPTPQNGTASVLVIGLVARGRVLPLAWRVAPGQAAWAAPMIVQVRAMVDEIRAALPPGCRVTLVVDRGLTGPALIDLCRAVGWDFVFRVSVSAAQANRVRRPGAADRPLWDLVTRPGQRFAERVALFKDAGWREVELTIHWAKGEVEPWVLVSDAPAGAAVTRCYRRRTEVEATYQDAKKRGFQVEASKLVDLARFDRLLLALHLAWWWAQQLGWRVIRQGRRRWYDRADRRDLSILRLGRRELAEREQGGRCPPLPFHRRHGQLSFIWLA